LFFLLFLHFLDIPSANTLYRHIVQQTFLLFEYIIAGTVGEQEPAMSGNSSELQIRAVAEDGFDGAIRILNDLQRFGFVLSSLTIRKDDDAAYGYFKLQLAIGTRPDAVPDDLAGRLSRHPGVVSVQAAPDFEALPCSGSLS
jgi:hypothetical protein